MADLGADVARLLRTRELGRSLHFHESLGSTNDEALRLAREGAAAGTVVMADRQTAGRGRRGRAWESPAGAGIYLSVILRPALPPQRAPELVPTVAVAAAEALAGIGVEAGIKWPNDLEIGGRKVAGILTELSAAGERVAFVVVGIGINANLDPAALPEALRPIATSVRAATGGEVDRATLAATLLLRLEGWLERHAAEGFSPIRAAYRARSSTLGRRVRVVQGERVLEGVAADVDGDGALLLRRDDGALERIHTGDVTSLRLAR